jgi:hypothetical protein
MGSHELLRALDCSTLSLRYLVLRLRSGSMLRYEIADTQSLRVSFEETHSELYELLFPRYCPETF